MPDDPRVRHLVEEILDTNVTPEDVCSGDPDVLPAVRKRLAQLQQIGHRLDEMFPSNGSTNYVGTTISNADIELPAVSGYEVEAILGRGGMGIVFRARHLRLGRAVALKMALTGAYAELRERERFQREAVAVAGLRHPNIVQIYDVGDSGGRPYFTMEYIEGGSLAQKLSGTPQPVREAAALLMTLAEAVQAAHESGVVHRDLKPANVLLSAGGAPKITDFGLARRLGDGVVLTLSGTPMGTPFYMAPEQAQGKAHDVGPAADVYALGAILYELLTGRPPFRAVTAMETMQQVMYQEPVHPSRLNNQVPHDLDTICLKCLHKEPPRRYASAAALADDLRRFQEGRPIQARPSGLGSRLWRWCRRRPAEAALVATALAFIGAAVVGGLWLESKRAESRRAVEGDLREVADLQQQARWRDASETLKKAETRLADDGPGDLRNRIGQARRDLDLVTELDRVRLSRVTGGNLAFYKTKADRDYVKAFKEAGVAKAHESPETVAARVQASAARVALMAALDDWAVCATDKDRRDWLLAVARTADPDPQGWRDRIRDPASWEGNEALTQLASTVPVSGQPVPLLLALAERLGASGGDMPAFLKRVQNEHPADFWVNLILGDSLLATAFVEAGGYYRAALASRPEAAVVYTALGDALRAQKLPEEAIGYYRRAVRINPTYARGHTNLGNILSDAGRMDEALACFRTALDADPNYAWAHFDMANILKAAGRVDEAVEHYRRYHELDPANPYVAHLLRSDLVRRGKGEQVRLEWKKALDANPPEHDAWYGYAELCLFLGHEDEYRQARRDLLRHFGASNDPFVAERTARAILLLPAAEDELQTAAALVKRALAAKETTAKWIYPYFLFAKGLAEYRQSRFDSAISTMQSRAAEVMGPCPRLVIAMAQHRKGQTEQARQTLAAEIARFDWHMARVLGRDDWIWHILRREAENMIFPQNARFLEK